MQLTVPANWSAPQKTTSNAAGYVTATSGGSAVAVGNIAIAGSGPWTIDITVPSALASGQTVVVTYGDTSVNAGGAAAAPSAAQAGSTTFTIKEKSTSGGSLATVAGTQTVAVSNSADGAGTGAILPTSTLAGTTNNTETATYTATTGGVAANGVVEVTVPANWSAPQKTTSNAAGYVTATAGGSAVAAGNIAIAGSGPWTIDVTVPSALNSGQTVVVKYGDTSVNAGGAATAPSAANAGNSVFTIKERSTSGGTLTTVAVGGGTQTVAVNNSADGAGTGAVLPTSTLAGTTNNTISGIYSVTTGGIAANGVVEMTVPANWSAPQKTTNNAAGYVTATAGGSAVAAANISVSGSGPWTIDVTVPSAVNSGQSVVISYGDTSVSALGAAAAPGPSQAGNYTFTIKEKSTSGGTLTTVGVGGGTQTIAVNTSADGSGSVALGVTSVLAGTTTTEAATYTVATGGMAANGVVELSIPAGWSTPQKTVANNAGFVTATANGSAVAAANISIAGSGPWTIDVTVPSALSSGQTVVITYGDTGSGINPGGAAAVPGAGSTG